MTNLHIHHLEISKIFYQNQSNQTGLWPAQGLQVLKTVSANLGLNNTDNQLKNGMWNFDGSYINIAPKTGTVKWDSN